ncbi:hypothetical protein Tco_0805057, partial [Tanacetum coccineum]
SPPLLPTVAAARHHHIPVVASEVHNDLQYKFRMVANDSTIKTSWPSLMDILNSSSMSMETWSLEFARRHNNTITTTVP